MKSLLRERDGGDPRPHAVRARKQPRGRGFRLRWAAAALLLAALGCAAEAARETPSPWNHPPKRRMAGVEHGSFRSPSMGVEVGFNVLLPPGYGSSGARYPVLYWLHDLSGDETRSAEELSGILLEIMREGRVSPLLVVFASGGIATMYADSADGSVRAETAIARELVPHIDATYRTIAAREGRAIEGMSMGGFGALALAFKHPGLFASVAAYAPSLLELRPRPDGSLGLALPGMGPFETFAVLPLMEVVYRRMFDRDPSAWRRHSPWVQVRENADAIRRGLPIRLVVGSEDLALEATRKLDRLLTELAIPHELEIVDGAEHDIRELYRAAGVRGLRFHDRNLGRAPPAGVTAGDARSDGSSSLRGASPGPRG